MSPVPHNRPYPRRGPQRDPDSHGAKHSILFVVISAILLIGLFAWLGIALFT